jgi:hypothetical protein
MTPVIDLNRDDDVVRELLAPFARVQPVTFRRRPSRERLRRFRPLVAVPVGVIALAAVGAGAAVGTGVLPWWKHHEAIMALPFFTSADPAALPGSIVNISAPGPEGTTFEVVTNDTEMVGTVQQHCWGIFAEDAQGRPQGAVLRGCGPAGALVARGDPRQVPSGATTYAVFSGAPSGATYAVFTGPTPVSTAATVALVAGDGDTVTTEPVEGGYYLVYAPTEQAAGRLVFYDQRGRVVDELASPNP